MKEYKKLLDFYFNSSENVFTRSYRPWYQKDYEKADFFLRKYYLEKEEYFSRWQQIQGKIFYKLDKGIENQIFKNYY